MQVCRSFGPHSTLRQLVTFDDSKSPSVDSVAILGGDFVHLLMS